MSVALQQDDHYPVMLPEVLAALSPRDGGVYVDGTFGAGGYTRAILDAADCQVYAIDRDENAVSAANDLKQEYGARFTFLRGRFGDVKALLNEVGAGRVDGFVLDIGVSSMQIDQADRGFSFRFDGPLDMRMDTSCGQTAADIVNTYEEEDLANVLYQYGEEKKSRRIARKLVELRQIKPFAKTSELADAIRDVIPKTYRDKIDPATRSFQALRIAVNDELGELERALNASEDILIEGGRLAVVSFHSLEDGMVKRFLREKEGGEQGSRHLPQVKMVPPTFRPVKKKAIKPSEKEVSENPRSRSARLRAAVRCEIGGQNA
jgi:16S rRNA (cytosine1402-N4)-methyltransferase